MDLSVIIVNWNVRELLDRCLASIFSNVTELDIEVIVVDNASQDDSVEMVTKYYPQVMLIVNQTNEGFCRGNNQGIEMSRGDYLVLLNPDTEVYPGAMETMIAFLRARPTVGVVGPTIINAQGVAEANGTRFPTLSTEIGKMLSLERLLKIEYDFTDYESEQNVKFKYVDVVCGACMVVRRVVFDEIGALDEQLFMFYEETDFCLRADRAGWRTVYLPDARIYHHWMGSVRQDEIRAAKRFFRSRHLYFRKHHGWRAALVLRILGYGAVLVRGTRIRLVQARKRCRGLFCKLVSGS